MAILTVEGTYRDGKVELDELPAENTGSARVLVTFLPTELTISSEHGPENTRRAAGERLIARMQAGIDFGGERFSREELYAARLDNIARRDR